LRFFTILRIVKGISFFDKLVKIKARIEKFKHVVQNKIAQTLKFDKDTNIRLRN